MVRSLRVLGLFLSLLAGVAAFSPLPLMPSSTAPRPTVQLWGTTQATVAVVTIEKETVKTGPAILDRPQVDSPEKERKQSGNEAWEVRIYNDSSNTREHVARSLVQVTGMSEINAYQTMMQAHQNGIAVVGRWVYEVAEMYNNELQKNGIVCDIVPVDEEL